MRFNGITISRFQDGLIVEDWSVTDTLGMLRQLGLLRSLRPRAIRMAEQMDAELFGNCSWHGECQAACPKRIGIDVIARMNWEYFRVAIARSSDGGDGSS